LLSRVKISEKSVQELWLPKFQLDHSTHLQEVEAPFGNFTR